MTTERNRELKNAVALVKTMPFDQYKAAPGINASAIKAYRRSRREGHDALFGSEDVKPPSKEMQIGTAVHSVLLDNANMSEVAVKVPDELLAKNGAASTKAAKEWIAEHEGKGVPIFKEGDLNKVRHMVDKCRRHPYGWVFKQPGAMPEASIWWPDETLRVMLKARPDLLVENEGAVVIIDLKTTEDARPFAFQRVADNFAYLVQAAHYRAAVKAVYPDAPVHFFFFVVDAGASKSAVVYRPSDYDLDNADDMRDETLAKMAVSMHSNDWDKDWCDYWEKNVVPLSMSKWAFKDDAGLNAPSND